MTKDTNKKSSERSRPVRRFSGGLFFRLTISFSAIIAAAIIAVGLAILIKTGKNSFADTLSAMLTTYWMLILIALGIGISIGAIMINKILKPLKPLERGMQQVVDGDFSIRLASDATAATEIRELVDSFNKMTQELEQNEILKTDFISNVSHEFKTPLSSISGYATLLNDDTLTKEERETYVEHIRMAVQKLSTLTGNMLKLSKLEHSATPTEKKKFNLSDQIRQCILMAESKWTAKELVMDVNLSELTYYGDENMLAQVWQNLIDNAVKFTPRGGRIMISLTEIPQGVRFLIRDSGIGMNDKVLAHVFEKFYQGDLSHSAEGNGLGLALAKRIVDAAGGTIKVESELDKGSVFTVILPANK